MVWEKIIYCFESKGMLMPTTSLSTSAPSFFLAVLRWILFHRMAIRDPCKGLLCVCLCVFADRRVSFPVLLYHGNHRVYPCVDGFYTCMSCRTSCTNGDRGLEYKNGTTTTNLSSFIPREETHFRIHMITKNDRLSSSSH